MKRFAMLCLAMTIMTAGIGCCGFPFGQQPYYGGYGGGGGYQPYYNPNCPGGNCGVGYGYAPQAAVPMGAAPVAAAPTYYAPAPMTAMNYLPTY